MFDLYNFWEKQEGLLKQLLLNKLLLKELFLTSLNTSRVYKFKRMVFFLDRIK